MNLKFAFIGAGNLATNLSIALKKNGHSVVQVYSRTINSAKLLANKLDADFTNNAKDITLDADIYIVALKDSIYEEVLSQIDFGDKIVIHCSGSLSISVLEKYAQNFGVIYPLQTFSKNREINFKEVPVFVEANSTKNQQLLVEIAKEVSNSVSILNSEKRIYLHIAAVFACNFVNHFYNIAADILNTENIPFEVLRPLVLETAEKVQVLCPDVAQTGPAVRFDENIISKHLKELKGKKNYDELYNIISKSIFEHHQKTN